MSAAVSLRAVDFDGPSGPGWRHRIQPAKIVSLAEARAARDRAIEADFDAHFASAPLPTKRRLAPGPADVLDVFDDLLCRLTLLRPEDADFARAVEAEIEALENGPGPIPSAVVDELVKRVRAKPLPLTGHSPCGASTCPLPVCVAAREAAAERQHKREVSKTLARFAPSDPEDRGLYRSAVASPFRSGRSRAVPQPEAARVVRPLTNTETTAALKTLSERKIRRGVDRREFVAEGWLELVNPTADVAERERSTPFAERVRKAIERAQFRLRRQLS